MKIDLPENLTDKFVLAQTPPQETMYFGKEVGHISFSKMTETQAIRLVKMGSPYIQLKKKEEKSAAEKTK